MSTPLILQPSTGWDWLGRAGTGWSGKRKKGMEGKIEDEKGAAKKGKGKGKGRNWTIPYSMDT